MSFARRIGGTNCPINVVTCHLGRTQWHPCIQTVLATLHRPRIVTKALLNLNPQGIALAVAVVSRVVLEKQVPNDWNCGCAYYLHRNSTLQQGRRLIDASEFVTIQFTASKVGLDFNDACPKGLVRFRTVIADGTTHVSVAEKCFESRTRRRLLDGEGVRDTRIARMIKGLIDSWILLQARVQLRSLGATGIVFRNDASAVGPPNGTVAPHDRAERDLHTPQQRMIDQPPHMWLRCAMRGIRLKKVVVSGK